MGVIPLVVGGHIPAVSIVIAAHNQEILLPRCLEALERSVIQPMECIVVDDGSTDRSAEIAVRYGARVVSTGSRCGPAHARNLGVSVARGDVILFLDSDVCVHPDTIGRMVRHFEHDRCLSAMIGAYDDAPDVANFCSQFRNLLHCYTHRAAKREASTFWSGCGAVRRACFLDVGGFDPSYERPAVEDIEFGARLIAAGGKILLDPAIQVKHLKGWTFWNMIRTDVLDRGIPWAALILRSGSMPDDLNVRWSQRISVTLTGLLIGLAVLGHAAASAVCLLVLIGINAPFYQFLISRRGAWFAARAVPVHVAFYICCGISFTAAVAGHAVLTVRQVVGAAPKPRFLD